MGPTYGSMVVVEPRENRERVGHNLGCEFVRQQEMPGMCPWDFCNFCNHYITIVFDIWDSPKFAK